MTYYSSNQSETYWQKLDAKTLLGAKRECTKEYYEGDEIEIAVVDESLEEECRQYELVVMRKPYGTKWITVSR